MPKKVYIETTIPSFYFENRKDAINQARRTWTRRWWDLKSHEDTLFTSEAVLVELQRPNYPVSKRAKALRLLRDLPILEITQEVRNAASFYINQFAMPREPSLDAIHLALASAQNCDILLTWNCEHLANANKVGHIRHVNELLGLATPEIVTPMQLLGERL